MNKLCHKSKLLMSTNEILLGPITLVSQMICNKRPYWFQVSLLVGPWLSNALQNDRTKAPFSIYY